MVGAGGDLRQVGDGDDLAAGAELLHEAADGLGDGAADAGVDLVEDQRRRRCAGALALGADDGDGEGDSRQLAARGDLGERPRRRAGVAGDQELDRFDAERLRRVGGDELDLEAAAGHAELLHRRVTAAANLGAAARRAAETRGASPSYRRGSYRRPLRRVEVGGRFHLLQFACHCSAAPQVGGWTAMAPRQR